MLGMAQYPDKWFDLAVVDPPYGINAPSMNMGVNETRVRDGRSNGAVELQKKNRLQRLNGGGGKLKNRILNTSKIDWDYKTPEQDYFDQLIRISKNQIIWGGNYFTDKLQVSRCWVCWDKLQPWENFSQIELAWTSLDSPTSIFKYSNTGGNPDKFIKIHPTQKPIKLYQWIYKNYLPSGGKVIDTHLGSGSNRIAADKAGNIDFVGYELDKDYYEAQEKRWKNYKSQLTMF
jgi:site-specific DNA-methyltransferase (adenine-specific)